MKRTSDNIDAYMIELNQLINKGKEQPRSEIEDSFKSNTKA